MQSQSQSQRQPQRRGRRGKLTCNMKMHFSLLIENFLRELSFIFFAAARSVQLGLLRACAFFGGYF